MQSSNNNDVTMFNNDDLVMMNNVDINPGNSTVDLVTADNNDIIDTVFYKDHIVPANNNHDKPPNDITIFNIDDATLNALKQESATSTARSILRYLYPNPEMNFKLSNMDKALVDAIIGKSSFFSILLIYSFLLHRRCREGTSE